MPAGELSLGGAVALAGAFTLPLGLRGRLTAFTPVGRGGAQISSGTVYGGLAVDIRRTRLRPHVLVEGGAGLVRGRSFEENRSEAIPRARMRLGTAVSVLSWLTFVPEIEVPIHRVFAFRTANGMTTTTGEPVLRGGLALVTRSSVR